MENQNPSWFREPSRLRTYYVTKAIVANRREIIEKSKAWRFTGAYSQTMESIYFKNNTKGFKGKEMKNMFFQLSKKSHQQIKSEKYLQSYRMEGEKMFGILQKMQNDLVDSLKFQIESKILADEKQKYFYLLQQLDNPSQLKLLFRASQHNFRVNKFHECCDGIKDTVTIVRNEFGKTTAAYTPLKWSSPSFYAVAADDSKSSFLLQLELKQKMTLTQPQKAIENHKGYGIIFGGGGGADLKIADRCNQNQESYSDFPYSYNCNGKYKRDTESFAAFCGSIENKFRVLEYEVFQVVK